MNHLLVSLPLEIDVPLGRSHANKSKTNQFLGTYDILNSSIKNIQTNYHKRKLDTVPCEPGLLWLYTGLWFLGKLPKLVFQEGILEWLQDHLSWEKV